MNKRHILALAAGLAAVMPVTVLADWESTRWGMTPEETLAVLDGASSHDPAPQEVYQDGGRDYAPRVKLSREIEGIAGTVSLLFDTDDQLHFVLFNPLDIANCDALDAALTERHGDADAVRAGTFQISDWAADGNGIKLTNAPSAGICSLSYSAG